MLNFGERPCLQLVKREKRKLRLPTQAALFPSARKAQLIVVSLPGVSDHEFLSLIASTQPAVVVDLRRAARFSVGHLNRRTVLKCFEQNNSLYFDGMAISDCWAQHDRAPDVAALLKELRTIVPDLISGAKSPILFLVTQSNMHTELLQAIITEWRNQTSAEWDVYEVREGVPAKRQSTI